MDRKQIEPQSDRYREIEAKLLETQKEWERRLGAIQADRRRQRAPLEADFAEQAVQRENDGALDALDERGRQELAAIESALARIAAGDFGRCVRCDEPIPPARIQAQPTAATCVACARADPAA